MSPTQGHSGTRLDKRSPGAQEEATNMILLVLGLACTLIIGVRPAAVADSKDCAKLLTDVNSCTLQLFLMSADGKFAIPKDAEEVDNYCE